MDDSDRELLDRFVEQRDQAAFAVLVARHSPLVLGVCQRVLEDLHDADDAAQAAFLVLARRATRLDRQPPLGPWLYRVALNLARSARRQRHRRERLQQEAAAMPSRTPHPHADGFTAEIDAAMATLPECERSAITLFHLEGRPVEEVAQLVGRPVGTVCSWLARGRERLRRQLVRRGVAVSAVFLLSALGGLNAAVVSGSFASATAAAAASYLTTADAATPAAALASQGIKTMGLINTIKTAIIAASLVAMVGAAGWLAAAEGGGGKKPALLLGAVGFPATPERPLGWRGDGSGCYPGAMPPLTWGKDRNVVWRSSRFEKWGKPIGNPLIIGDRIFLTAQPTTLVCLSKVDGRILWLRSNNYFDATPEAERKVPGFADTIAPLAAKLRQLEDAIAQDGGLKGDKVTGLVAEREKLDDQIYEAIRPLDKKFHRPHPDHPTAPTPVSDGKSVFIWTGHGVAACYDLDGNRKWATFANRCPDGGGHHGSHGSPALVDGKLLAFIQDLIAFDAKTGAVAWTVPVDIIGGYNYSLPAVSCDGQPTALVIKAEKSMLGIRVADGKQLWASDAFSTDGQQFPWTEGSLVLHDGVSFWSGSKGLLAFRYPDTAGMKGAMLANRDFNDKALACGSCLYDNGLIYSVNPAGELRVFEAATTKLVYSQTLGIAGKGDGFHASLTLAGEHLYATSNAGATEVFATGRTFKSEAINLMDENTWASPVFEGKYLYLRTAGGLYCISDK